MITGRLTVAALTIASVLAAPASGEGTSGAEPGTRMNGPQLTRDFQRIKGVVVDTNKRLENLYAQLNDIERRMTPAEKALGPRSRTLMGHCFSLSESSYGTTSRIAPIDETQVPLWEQIVHGSGYLRFGDERVHVFIERAMIRSDFSESVDDLGPPGDFASTSIFDGDYGYNAGRNGFHVGIESHRDNRTAFWIDDFQMRFVGGTNLALGTSITGRDYEPSDGMENESRHSRAHTFRIATPISCETAEQAINDRKARL